MDNFFSGDFISAKVYRNVALSSVVCTWGAVIIMGVVCTWGAVVTMGMVYTWDAVLITGELTA